MRRLSFVLALTALVPLSGCLTDLGECDWGAATELVFEDDGACASQTNGQPMYAGQALVMGSCGNGAFCHTAGLDAAGRYGGNVNIDLNVGPACRGHGCGYTSGPAPFRDSNLLLVAGSECVSTTNGFDFADVAARPGDILTVNNQPVSDTTTEYTIQAVFSGGDPNEVPPPRCPSPSIQVSPVPTRDQTGAIYQLDRKDYPQARELANLERLRSSQASIVRHAREILRSLDRMPIHVRPQRPGLPSPVPAGPRYRSVPYDELPAADVQLRWRVVDASFSPPAGQCIATPEDMLAIAPTEADKVEWWPLVPAVGTDEGNEIVRNWLACGAPVVESAALPFTQAAGQSCMQNDDASHHVGTCMAGVPPVIVPPEPTWCSIYENVIEPLCAGCHTKQDRGHFVDHHTDLSNVIRAYNQMVAQPPCGPTENATYEDPFVGNLVRQWNLIEPPDDIDPDPNVVVLRPGAANRSLLMRKLDNNYTFGWTYTYAVDPMTGDRTPILDSLHGIPVSHGERGEPMPGRDALLDESVLAPIREWINAGAVFTVPDEDRSMGLRCRVPDTNPATLVDNNPNDGLLSHSDRCTQSPE